jgi:LPS export ABC transporter protein LptC
MTRLPAIFVLLFLIACSSAPEEDPTEISTEEYPDQESWNSTIIITKEGQTIGILEAAYIKKFTQKNLTYIEDGLKVDFFNTEGNHTSVLTSEGGLVHDVKQDMIAYGNVVVVSDSGMTLFTDTLKWDNNQQKIISEIPVMITSETDTVYGDTFISDPNLSNYTITNSRAVSNRRLKLN